MLKRQRPARGLLDKSAIGWVHFRGGRSKSVILVFVSGGRKDMAGCSCAKKLRVLCIGDQGDDVSIPFQIQILDPFSTMASASLGISQETFDAVDLVNGLRFSTTCSSCKLMLTQGGFTHEVVVAAALREEKGS